LVSNFCREFLGEDSRRDSEMTKLLNWLVFGYSSSDVHGASPNSDFDDSFFVIGKDSLHVYTNGTGFKYIS